MATTKDGRPIKFKYTPNKPDRGLNRGWVLHQLEAFVDGRLSGYLKMAYIPEANMDRFYPTTWHWEERMEGRYGLIEAYESGDKDRLWLAANRYARWDWGAESAPEPKQRDRDLARRVADNQKPFLKFKAFFTDRPFVDYIKVAEDLRRQGIGKALYLTGARWMAKMGMPLYASGVQSEEAQASWQNLRTLKRVPIREEPSPYGDKQRTMIDYRRVASRYLAARKVLDLSDWNLEGLAEGTPVTLYHGTNRSFKSFDRSKTRTELVNKFFGGGIFLTPSKDVAEQYANANRNIGFEPDLIDDLKAKNPKAGAVLSMFYHKGNAVWDMWDREFFKLDEDGDFGAALTDYMGGVDPNSLADVARWIIGTKLKDEPDSSDSVDIQDVFDAFGGGSTGMPHWIYDELEEIGLDGDKYRPKVYTVTVTVTNPLVTASKSEAMAAPRKGYDCTVFYGSGLVGNVPEVVVYDASNVRIKHVSVV